MPESRRVARQMNATTIVAAPDELQEPLRAKARMQFLRTLPGRRPT